MREVDDPALSSDPWAEFAHAAGWIDVENPARRTRVHATFSYVHPSATIGPRTIVFPQAYIGPNVVIGADCVIGPCACIGQPGFGYWRDEEGRQRYRQHTAGVVIGDDVHIGANACVDQGRHRPTRIGRGSRIDNLVHVGHNVEIGEDCVVVALTMIGGSAVIGDRAWVASATIRDWREIGPDALVGLGSVVVTDVAEGATVKGVPAR